MTSLRIFSNEYCPFAHRAWIALEESKTEYERTMIDLNNKSQEFLDVYAKANPIPNAVAKVPVLVISDGSGEEKLIYESSVVAEYVAEKYGGPDGAYVPPNLEDRAVMRLFVEHGGSCFFNWPLLKISGSEDTAAVEAAVNKYKDGLKNLNAFLMEKGSTEGPFLFGTSFSLAECILAPFVFRDSVMLPNLFPVEGDSKSMHPADICEELGLQRLQSWIAGVIARPSVTSTVVPQEKMITKFRTMLGK